MGEELAALLVVVVCQDAQVALPRLLHPRFTPSDCNTPSLSPACYTPSLSPACDTPLLPLLHTLTPPRL